MNTYIFIYKPQPSTYFAIYAMRYYEAVLQLEQLLGPEKLWVYQYTCLCNGTVIAPLAA